MESAENSGSRVPMVLRVMPRERHTLARVLDRDLVLEADDLLWELVDATADETVSPAGVAVTRPGPGNCVTASGIAVGNGDSAGACVELVLALIATFRGRAARALLVDSSEDFVVSTLIALGFLPSAPGGRSPYVLTL